MKKLNICDHFYKTVSVKAPRGQIHANKRLLRVVKSCLPFKHALLDGRVLSCIANVLGIISPNKIKTLNECLNVCCEERRQRWRFPAKLLPNKLRQLFFFSHFVPSGPVFLLWGAGASSLGHFRHLVASVRASAGGSSSGGAAELAKNKTTGPQWDEASCTADSQRSVAAAALCLAAENFSQKRHVAFFPILLVGQAAI